MTGTDTQHEKPPFMPSRKKQSVSNDELDTFYKTLRGYYLDIPYNKKIVKSEEKYYKVLAVLSRVFATLKRTRILHKERTQENQAMIYTANHIGSYDQFHITKALKATPLHYLVKKKVTTWPIRWNLIYKRTGVVVVDHESISSWQQAKAKLVQYLLNGRSVFIFAEGSRRGEDNIGEFSSGIAQIAQESGLSVCTLAIKNTAKLILRKPIVCVGETVAVYPREDLKEATKRIKAGVVNAYNEILTYEQERWSRK